MDECLVCHTIGGHQSTCKWHSNNFSTTVIDWAKNLTEEEFSTFQIEFRELKTRVFEKWERKKMIQGLKKWYKDRDFPEVKAGNDDIVAVVPDEKQLNRLISEHNILVDTIAELTKVPRSPALDQFTITLNKYQRDNLLWLLLIAWQNPELGLGTGDWVGEIPFLLNRVQDYGVLTEEHKPNVSIEAWRAQFKHNFLTRDEVEKDYITKKEHDDLVRIMSYPAG